MVRLLLTTGEANVDLPVCSGWTPLSWAAEKGSRAVVLIVLDIGAADVNLMGNFGRTPARWAAEKGQNAVFNLLQRVR